MNEWKVPVQSLIDHIKTATDVDPWAKDMAAVLLARAKPVEPDLEGGGGQLVARMRRVSRGS